MRSWAVLTTFKAEQWPAFAGTMVRSFRHHWPIDVPLHVVVEGGPPPDLAATGAQVHDLAASAPLWRVFERMYAAQPGADGMQPAARGQAAVYDYRHDAGRFAPKVFAIAAAAQQLRGYDRLIWLDADTVTHQAVTRDWLEAALLQPLPSGLTPYCSYLGRDALGIVPETGFLCFNARHPAHGSFMRAWAGLYANGTVFSLPWQEDAFTFDWLRRQREQEHALVSQDLGVGVRGGHVFINSILGECLDHLKGPRKRQGHSYANDLTWPRQEPWWQAVREGRRPRWDDTPEAAA